MRDVVLSVRGLCVGFEEHRVLQDLDLDLHRGEILGVVGASGTGKSVLLRTIVGLNSKQSGEVCVLGSSIDRKKRDNKRRSVERRWGVLFQHGALISSLTVKQNIEIPMREHLQLPKKLMDELAMLKLQLVGLPEDAANKMPSELSGGMIKRASLARALALDPELVFLDEPTSGLDPIGAAAFDDLIIKLRDTLGLTVFMVTHDLSSLYTACDRIAVLAEGKVLVTGDMNAMKQVDHPWVRDYFYGVRARHMTG
ncbi:ABC transporter ATP-binding protein [Coralliovum pocilloporae]|uniref:ABC transporter ATP-binding protein n=1 Tax=Coralliovum pocilloporae TaxID=3066369 RepID=UPI003307C353